MKLTNKVKYYDFNTIGRDLISTDIHGCYEDFMYFLEKLNFDSTKDIMYNLGDNIDRGPDSLSCLQLMYMKWFRTIAANHEMMMVDALLNPKGYNSYDDWIYNGGNWQYGVDKQELEMHCQYIIDNIPYVIVIGKDTDRRINLVHAELYKADDEDLADNLDIDQWNFTLYNEDELVWGRNIATNKHMYTNNPKYSNYGLSTTYCGHTPIDKPFECLNHRFIDTGAVFYHTKMLDRSLTIVDATNDIVYTMDMRSKEIIAKPSEEVFKPYKPIVI